MWAGQFIGLRPIGRFSTSVKYMWSRYFSQCPDWRNSSTSYRIGVRTSSYPRARFSLRHRSLSTFQIAVPAGFQKGLPGDSSENMNRSSSRPSLR